MNYYFKNNNIYWGSVLVADDMRDATKQLNDLEEAFTEELDILHRRYQPIGKIRMMLRRSAILVNRNSDEFKLIKYFASELGVDPDVLITKDDVKKI